MRPNIKIIAILIVALFFFAIDQIVKLLFQSFGSGVVFEIIPNLFKLEYMTNTGIAFGIAFNYWLLLFFYFVIIAALCYLIYRKLKEKDCNSAGALIIIVFGAVSNLIDRLIFGHVIDYFYLKNFSVFNLADIMIVFGAIAFLLFNIKNNDENNS